MQARYYDPLIGRFLSRDPIGFSPQRPEMFSSYTYVGNDPINKLDPFGLAAEDPPKVEPPKIEPPKTEPPKGSNHKTNKTPSNLPRHQKADQRRKSEQTRTTNKDKYNNGNPKKGTTKKQRNAAKKLMKKLDKYIKVGPVIILPPGSENLAKLPSPASPQNEGESAKDFCSRDPYCI